MREPGALDGIGVTVLQHPSASSDPAHRRSEVAAEEEPERMPERAPGRALGLAESRPFAVRVHPGGLALVVAPDHVGSEGESLEVLRAEVARLPCAVASSANASPQLRRSMASCARSRRSATVRPTIGERP